MDIELITGTYSHIKNDAGVDFWIKLGVSECDAKSFVGTHWSVKIGSNEKKLWVKMDCEEFPALNLFMSGLEEGKNYSIPDKGFGKSSIVFTLPPGKPNMFHSIYTTEKYGTYEMIETYSEDGIKMEYVCKEKGVSYVENWCRVVKDTGSFRFKRGENLEVIKEMFPDLPAIDEGYKLKWSQVGDTFHEIATFGDGTSFNTSWKYDVETPFMDCTFLMTKIPGGSKTICKNKAGKIQEYTVKFTDNGATQYTVDHASGKTGVMEFVRFVDFAGEFKPIANIGGGEVMATMGCPTELYQKIMNDPTTRMIIKEVGCGHFSFDFKSAAMPKEPKIPETVFSLGEEFVYENPFDPTDPLKTIVTAKDNIMLAAGKGKLSFIFKYIFTDNFLIRDINLEGTGMSEKTIFVRC